jgi:hypothetical protein
MPATVLCPSCGTSNALLSVTPEKSIRCHHCGREIELAEPRPPTPAGQASPQTPDKPTSQSKGAPENTAFSWGPPELRTPPRRAPSWRGRVIRAGFRAIGKTFVFFLPVVALRSRWQPIRWPLFFVILIALGLGLNWLIPFQALPRCAIFCQSAPRVLSLSHDGEILLIEDVFPMRWQDAAVEAWNTRTGTRLQRVLRGEGGAAVSPDAHFMFRQARAAGDSFEVIDLRSGRTWQATSHVVRLWFSPSSKFLCVQGDKGSTVFDSVSGRRVCDVTGAVCAWMTGSPAEEESVLFQVGGGRDVQYHSIDLHTGKKQSAPSGFEMFEVSPAGKLFGKLKNEWVFWDNKTGETKALAPQPQELHRADIRFSPDGAVLGWLRRGARAVTLWNLSSGKQFGMDLPPPHELSRDFGFSPDSRFLVYWAKGKLVVADAHAGTPLWDDAPETRHLGFPRFAADSTLIVVPTEGSRFDVRDALSGTRLHSIPAAQHAQHFTRNGDFLLSIEGQGTTRVQARVFEVASAHEVARLHIPNLREARVSEDGKTLVTIAATAPTSPSIQFWNLPVRRPLRWFTFAPVAVGAIFFVVFVVARWRRAA